MSARASSTVDTTRTTTATTSRQSGARRKGPITGPSALERAAAQWAVMSGEERNSYAALTNDMVAALEPTLPNRKTAYGTFVTLSSANLAADKPLDTTAKPYAVAPPLPGVRVNASYINGTLKITLTPDFAYPHAVAVKCARPILAATDVYSPKAFKRIGSIPALSGVVDITDLFLSRYRLYGTGYKVALELTGVVPGGFHTSGLFVFGLVGSTAAEAVNSEPEDGKLAMG